MRPHLDRVTRQFLLILPICIPICQAENLPVPNELNSPVEEPLVSLPEINVGSPFRSASRPRNLTPLIDQDQLIQLTEDAVDSTRRRLLSTDINTPWQIMHGLLALRRNFEIRKNGQIVSGLDWVSAGPKFKGEAWFEKTPHGGRAHPYSRPWAFEGHANQFLAILSMSALPLDHEFMTPDGPITIADMVEHAQKSISTKDEPTWTLWALSRYLSPDATWRNNAGENWSIERLVSIQTEKPLKGTACGGTHGMFALAHARNVYLRSGKPLRGVWLDAEYKIRRQINTARIQQNSNGMLSSNYFRGREYKHDFNKRMASAGHILEFLMLSLPQDELPETWVRRAVDATARDLIKNRKAEVRCSPLYHAVNGLNIYLDRMKLHSPAEVAGSAETQPPFRAVDEPKAARLKSIPVNSISDSKPATSASKTVPAVAKSDQQSELPAGRTKETLDASPPKPVSALETTKDSDSKDAPSEPDTVTPLSTSSPEKAKDDSSKTNRRKNSSKDGEADSQHADGDDTSESSTIGEESNDSEAPVEPDESTAIPDDTETEEDSSNE
ncbi:MAG: hypothetical protein MK102_14315 [Fuerstiella sp.]|nr:hypothetical protein [Fuerstiella sp.]